MNLIPSNKISDRARRSFDAEVFEDQQKGVTG
jgi:hypothetical protein